MAFECHPIKLYICYFVIRTTKCSTTSDLQIFLPNSLLLSLDVFLCVNDRNFGFQDSPLVQMFVFLCVHAHPCVFLLGQHILIVEPLSLGSRQDPFHGAGSGICLYLICQGQSQSLKQSQEKYPDLLTLLLPQGCCFIFFLFGCQ